MSIFGKCYVNVDRLLIIETLMLDAETVAMLQAESAAVFGRN